MKFAQLKAVTEKLDSVKPKLTACRVEGANSLWSAHSIVKGASKVKDNVSKAIMAVLKEVADETKQKASTIGLEMKNALK